MNETYREAAIILCEEANNDPYRMVHAPSPTSEPDENGFCVTYDVQMYEPLWQRVAREIEQHYDRKKREAQIEEAVRRTVYR